MGIHSTDLQNVAASLWRHQIIFNHERRRRRRRLLAFGIIIIIMIRLWAVRVS